MESKQQTGDGRRAGFWPAVLAAIITVESVSAVPSVGPAWLSFDKLAHCGVFGRLERPIPRRRPPAGAGQPRVEISAEARPNQAT